MRHTSLLLLWLLSLLGGWQAGAQEVSLRLPDGELYLGVPIEIAVIAEGFQEEPRPEVSVEAPPGATLELFGYVPKVSASISIINGHVTRQTSVQHVFRYRLQASQGGRFRIGPFRVEQAGVVASSGEATIELGTVPLSDQVQLRLVLPERPVYPGERVPVTIEWAIAAELRQQVNDYSIVSPLFERSDVFQFLDQAPVAGDPLLQIQTPAGPLDLKARAQRAQSAGREFIVFSAERTLVPLRAGDYPLEAARVVVDQVTRWRRGLLGSRTPLAVQKLRAEDAPRRLIVKPVPLAGRPKSFAGAVGRGFSLEASADRSVVQTGDPITLTLELRGDGNIEGAGLPDLATSGLSPELFRLPSSDVAGRIDDGRKTFELQVRALDANVREIPGISYSYFDPESEKFQTVQSRPIALSVREADVVTAADVVGVKPLPASDGSGDPRPPELLPEPSGPLNLSGADLSIVTDRALLLRSTTPTALSLPAQAALYVGPLLLVGLALVGRRRRDMDPRLLERRGALRAAHKAIRASAGKPRAQAVAEIAEALRTMARASHARPAAFDAFIAECETVIYAPGSDAQPALEPEFFSRALALADELLEASP